MYPVGVGCSITQERLLHNNQAVELFPGVLVKDLLVAYASIIQLDCRIYGQHHIRGNENTSMS